MSYGYVKYKQAAQQEGETVGNDKIYAQNNIELFEEAKSILGTISSYFFKKTAPSSSNINYGKISLFLLQKKIKFS